MMGTVVDLRVEVHNGLVNCVRVGEPKEVCSLKNPGKGASCVRADGLLELSMECENGLIDEPESGKPWVRPLFAYLVDRPLTFAELVGSVLLRSFKGAGPKIWGQQAEEERSVHGISRCVGTIPKTRGTAEGRDDGCFEEYLQHYQRQLPYHQMHFQHV